MEHAQPRPASLTGLIKLFFRRSPWITALVAGLTSTTVLILKRPMDYWFFGPKLPPAALAGGVSSFLSVSGLVYGLMLAQLFATTQERLNSIREKLSEEISSLHSVLLNVKALPPEFRTAKEGVLLRLLEYTKAVAAGIDTGLGGSAGLHEDVEGLYSSLALLTDSAIPSILAERVVDNLQTAIAARYARCFHESAEFPVYVWFFIMALSAMMFWGVAMIKSGSDTLDFMFCMVTVFGIVYSLKMLAEADNPQVTEAKAARHPLAALQDSIAEALEPEALSSPISPPPTWQTASPQSKFRGAASLVMATNRLKTGVMGATEVARNRLRSAVQRPAEEEESRLPEDFLHFDSGHDNPDSSAIDIPLVGVFPGSGSATSGVDKNGAEAV